MSTTITTSSETATASSSRNACAAAPLLLKRQPRLLLHGLDTVQCCYYLAPRGNAGIDTEKLLAQREALRQIGAEESMRINIGGRDFLLASHGSRSGYPFVLSDADFRIEFGPNNKPSFFVTFRSEALWRDTAFALHRTFLDWAASLGYSPLSPETLTRVDFTFDYDLDVIDFDEDAFVTLSNKDAQHRQDGQIQTFTFGRSDVVLRVYDKVAEIQQQSGKVWLYDRWRQDHNVWRIEWQARKQVLRQFGIITFENLQERSQPLLQYLAGTHDTLRCPTTDGNRSRWPLHPLWVDLQAQIERLNCLGTPGTIDRPKVLAYRMQQCAIAVHGYLKCMAAIRALQTGKAMVERDEVLRVLQHELNKVHDPLSWRVDVAKRITEMELGGW